MNIKFFAFVVFGLVLFTSCGQPCGPGQQRVRQTRASADGKAYEEYICVEGVQAPKINPAAELQRQQDENRRRFIMEDEQRRAIEAMRAKEKEKEEARRKDLEVPPRSPRKP